MHYKKLSEYNKQQNKPVIHRTPYNKPYIKTLDNKINKHKLYILIVNTILQKQSKKKDQKDREKKKRKQKHQMFIKISDSKKTSNHHGRSK